MTTYSNANRDFVAKAITGVFVLITLGSLGFWALSSDKEARTSGMALSLIFLLVLTISWLLIPTLEKTASHFEIRTKLSTSSIPLNQIKSLTRAPQKLVHFRVFGVGGLFGYFGYFNGKELWYVTNLKKAIKIETNTGRVYLVSPKEPEVLLQALQNDINIK